MAIKLPPPARDADTLRQSGDPEPNVEPLPTPPSPAYPPPPRYPMPPGYPLPPNAGDWSYVPFVAGDEQLYHWDFDTSHSSPLTRPSFVFDRPGDNIKGVWASRAIVARDITLAGGLVDPVTDPRGEASTRWRYGMEKRSGRSHRRTGTTTSGSTRTSSRRSTTTTSAPSRMRDVAGTTSRCDPRQRRRRGQPGLQTSARGR